MIRKIAIAFLSVFLVVALVHAQQGIGNVQCSTDFDCIELGIDYICKNNVCAKQEEAPVKNGKAQTIECPGGFVKNDDGNCVPEFVPDGDFCIDSDKGIDFNGKGTVTYRPLIGLEAQSFTDFCVGDELHEYYCNDIGPDKFDCREDNQICNNGRCVYPENTKPFFSGRRTVSYNEYYQFFGDDLIARLIANPKVFDEEIILDYSSSVYPDFPNEWKKIRPYDPMLCYSNVVNPNPESKIKVNMELWDSEYGKIQEKEATCETGIFQNDCSAEFDSTHDLMRDLKISDDRAMKLHCNVEVVSGGEKVAETVSNELLVARYLYPSIVVNGGGSNESLSDFNVKGQYNYYRRISELGDNIEQEFENPELSGKVVLYGFGVDVQEKDIIFGYDTSKYFNFNYFKNLFSNMKFDPNKIDRLVIYSGFVLSTYNKKFPDSKAAGFTAFNSPIVYIGLFSLYQNSILSHELGHGKPITLCDETDNNWERQTKELPNGCPNPLPSKNPNMGVVENLLFKSPISPIKEIVEAGGEVSKDKRWNTISVIILPNQGVICGIESKSSFLGRLFGGDQGFVFSNPEECQEKYINSILKSYGHLMDIRQKYADNNQVSLSFELKKEFKLSTSVMGYENPGDYYPEVTHSHEKYCPLKEC